MESIYWVFTHRCNQRCTHCYNNSRPGGPTLTREEADAVLANLPECNRFILSGGEPLVEKELLFHILRSAFEKYGSRTSLMLQTNGDLLTEDTLDDLLDCHVDHISVASQDRYHVRRKGQRERLEAMFRSRGLRPPEAVDPAGASHEPREPTYAFWGATPDLWLGGLWPRGRALRHGLWKRDPKHNFCAIWSGALGFLDDGSSQQEIAIQLTLAYPCCAGTLHPLGDVSRESLTSILERCRGNPVFEALNRGEPADMGLAQGVTREFAQKRIEELGSVCLWCNEFFARYSRPAGARIRDAVPLERLARSRRRYTLPPSPPPATRPIALEAAAPRTRTTRYAHEG